VRYSLFFNNGRLEGYWSLDKGGRSIECLCLQEVSCGGEQAFCLLSLLCGIHYFIYDLFANDKEFELQRRGKINLFVNNVAY
jgi:hypothetical protein